MSPASGATSLYSNVAVTSIPPAQPIYNSPSSSESRFRRISPFTVPGFNPNAPNIPVSSSLVMRASNGPCFRSLASSTAMMAATPSPLSAPRVVPFAFTQSPSIYVSMGSFSKSFSMPGVAGLRIITLPASSTKDSKPKPFPKLIRKSVTFSICPDGRGI